MSKNNQVMGIAALMLIVAAQNQAAESPTPQKKQVGQPLGLSAIELPKLLGNLHRLALMVNRFDNLGQIALNPPPIDSLLPSADSMPSSGLPDLGSLVQRFAPILAGFQNNTAGSDYYEEENENALF